MDAEVTMEVSHAGKVSLAAAALAVFLSFGGCAAGGNESSTSGGIPDGPLPPQTDGSAESGVLQDAGGGASGDGGGGGFLPDAGQTENVATTLVDPGQGAWVPVASEDVESVCRLDPTLLAQADQQLAVPWAIIRYGRLCHSYMAEGMAPEEAWSTTKTLGAVVAGAVSYETAGIVPSGPMTGPFTDLDPVSQWITSFSYNPDAHVAHVMAMVAQNTSLALGQKTFQYDTIGTTQINSISDILNAVIHQDTATLGTDLDAFTQHFVFQPLGMTQSTWTGGQPTKIFAYSWSTTVLDMARVGLVMLHGGVWNGQRLLSAEWIYRMTHPSFEDANTGYGYLTWLNASSNHNFGGIPGLPSDWNGTQQVPRSPGTCAPVSVYPEHPHGLSDSPDCNYDAPYSCSQKYDVGVWQAVGFEGQVIQGHPGLDMVIVVKDLTPTGTGPTAPGILWNAVMPAVVAADPMFQGDTQGFCTAYGANSYAPDVHGP